MSQNGFLTPSNNRSPDPHFWLEFRCFDDGQSPIYSTSGNPATGDASTPSAGTDGTRFTAFPLLPPELRLHIWSYLIQPRVLVATCLERDERLPKKRAELDERTRGSFIPVLLHINREAREFALQHYELTFAWSISALLSETPTSSPAKVYFNYALDGLYLTGELEAYDSNGFNSPMVYFLNRDDTRRVKKVACAFADLGYPEQESDQIFGCLWHVVDRFRGCSRLLLGIREKDEEELARRDGYSGTLNATLGERPSRILTLGDDNVMQKIWSGWMGGVTVTGGTMADRQMILVREEDLAEAMGST